MIKQISGSSGRNGWRQRLFAWAHSAGEADEYDAIIAPYKRKLLSDLSGTVLEIGAGTGENFPFYAPGIHWIGIEPNLYMQERLLSTAEKYQIAGEVRAEVAEHLPVEDGSVDAVVSTLVLCSVSDQDTVLREVKRVLRPGGRFVFIEHVAAPDHSRQWWMQKLIKPAWRLTAAIPTAQRRRLSSAPASARSRSSASTRR